MSPLVIVRCTFWPASAKFTISRYAVPACSGVADRRTSNAVTATFDADSKTEWTTTPGGSGRGTAPSVMKWTVSAPASCGHAVGSPPPGAMRSSAESSRTRSVVGPSTRPSAVVATAVAVPDAATSRRASPSARSHRDSPLRVLASIDQEESTTTSTRPRDVDGVADRRDGRVMARASASAMRTVRTSDTARRIRSQRVSSRGSSRTRCQSSSDEISIRGGRSLRRNSHAASAATAPSSSQAWTPPIAPKVMRRTAPA